MPNFEKFLHLPRRKEKHYGGQSATSAPITPTASSRQPSPNSSQRTPPSSTPIQAQAHDPITAISASDTPLVVNDKRDVWEEAYQKLRSKEKDLVTHYEEILHTEESVHLAGSGQTAQTAGNPPEPLEVTDKTMRSRRLSMLARKKLDIIEKERWNSNYIEKAIKIIIIAKDFVGSAVSLEPHGALAWAGVSLLLPLLLNPSQQQSDVVDGIEQIPDIIARYQLYEENLPLEQTLDAVKIPYDSSSQLCIRFLDRTVDLYAIILEYQARAICQFSRHTIHRYGRDVFKADDWQKLLADIRKVDSECEKMPAAIASGMAKKALEKQDRRLSDLLKDFQDAKERSGSKEHRKCHQAFYFDYSAQKDRNPCRVPETCEWFLQNSTFREWRDNPLSPLLWVSADPGCGKSVLSKTLIDEQLLGIDPAVTKVCYFFFKDNMPENRNVTTAVAAIIHQLFSHDSRLIRHALPKYDKIGKQLARSLSEMWSILESAVTDPSAGNIVCLLDAFDECDREGRNQLVENLSRLFGDQRQNKSEPGMRLKFIITSRPYNDISRGFSNFLAIGSMIELAANDNSARISEEISLVIHAMVVPQLARKLRLDDHAKNSLQKALLKVENKTYLWLYLMSNALEESVGISTATAIEDFTKRIPSSVEDAYEAMLKRSPDQEKARTLLNIVLGAIRPLTVQELNIALAIKGSEESLDDLEMETDENFKDTARNLCGLLISFIDSKAYWLHQTAKEFLLQKSGKGLSSTWGHTFQQHTAELRLSTICIQYLLLCKLESGPCDDNATVEKRLEENPFLGYASKNWAVHAKGEGERQNIDIILQLLSSESRVLSMIQAMTLLQRDVHRRGDQGYPRNNLVNDDGETPLALAAVQGHEAVVKMLLERTDININSKDSLGRTPLVRATYLRPNGQYEDMKGRWEYPDYRKEIWHGEGNGHEAIVKLLLEREDIQADLKDVQDTTPLNWAAHCGNEAATKLLIKREDVQVNSRNNLGQTPLFCAAYFGREAIVKLLLEREDVDAGSENDIGETPLSSAAQYGHEPIVKLLLERKDVDVNSKDRAGMTPLLYAAQGGHEAMIRLLVEQDGLDIGLRDEMGRTALSWAASRCDEAAIKLLLEVHNVNADSDDNNGRTPLSWAAEYGKEAVVKLLLQKHDANAESNDKDGRTPLSWAAEWGEEAVVKLLLQKHDVNAESNDKNGWTPLSWAAQNGNETIVELLLKRDDVDAKSKDANGRTPLSWAAEFGYETIVRLLLNRDNVDAESKDVHGRTPLSRAAEFGHETIVRLLLNRDDVDAESKDRYGRTPLSRAAEKGYETIVRLLLNRDNVDAESKDAHGRTPLSWAAEKGYETIVRLLLNRDNVDAESKDAHGRTPLSWAAQSGQDTIVRLLLERDDVNAESKDALYRSPLSWAAQSDQQTIVRLLLKRDDVDAESKDANGRTPLSWAAENGQARIVKLLLELPNVNAGSKDENGRTPLSWLASFPLLEIFWCDYEESVKMLIDVGGANAESMDNDGMTPLLRAMENNAESLVKLLLERTRN